LKPPALGGISELVRGTTGESKSGHPNHWHADWQIVAVTEGDGWVRTYGIQHRTPSGSLFLIPPGLVHSNGVFDGGCSFRSMLVSDETVSEILSVSGLRKREALLGRSPVLISESATNSFSAFHGRLGKAKSGLSEEEFLSSVIRRIVQEQTEQEQEPLSSRQIHPAARRARDLLWDRASEVITLAELALKCGLSRFELSRQFSAAFGMPPHAWQLQARAEQAKVLLKNGASPGEVAIQMGFSDQAHFNRVFKRFTGYTPGRFAVEFRKIVQYPKR